MFCLGILLCLSVPVPVLSAPGGSPVTSEYRQQQGVFTETAAVTVTAASTLVCSARCSSSTGPACGGFTYRGEDDSCWLYEDGFGGDTAPASAEEVGRDVRSYLKYGTTETTTAVMTTTTTALQTTTTAFQTTAASATSACPGEWGIFSTYVPVQPLHWFCMSRSYSPFPSVTVQPLVLSVPAHSPVTSDPAPPVPVLSVPAPLSDSICPSPSLGPSVPVSSRFPVPSHPVTPIDSPLPVPLLVPTVLVSSVLVLPSVPSFPFPGPVRLCFHRGPTPGSVMNSVSPKMNHRLRLFFGPKTDGGLHQGTWKRIAY